MRAMYLKQHGGRTHNMRRGRKKEETKKIFEWKEKTTYHPPTLQSLFEISAEDKTLAISVLCTIVSCFSQLPLSSL